MVVNMYKHGQSRDQDFTRQCSYTNHVRWASYISSGCKFPIVYMCQKLWKLAGSRQSYCKNYLAYFFWPTLYMTHYKFYMMMMMMTMTMIMIFKVVVTLIFNNVVFNTYCRRYHWRLQKHSTSIGWRLLYRSRKMDLRVMYIYLQFHWRCLY